LGQPAYLTAKAKGETSMPVTPGTSEGIDDVVRLGPDDMVRATLPEPQFPAIDADPPTTMPIVRGRPDMVLKGSTPKAYTGRAARNDLAQGNKPGHLRRPHRLRVWECRKA
jgi:hypothetical protein